jgi:hypothetical protein
MTSKQKFRACASVLQLGMGAVLALCLVQCSAEDEAIDGPEPLASLHQAVAACGSVACTTVNDCTSGANWPLCAKPLSAVCHSVSHECTYQIKNDTSCPCLERDVRLCNVSPTVPGVQICTANAGRTATFWGTCTACASCT